MKCKKAIKAIASDDKATVGIDAETVLEKVSGSMAVDVALVRFVASVGVKSIVSTSVSGVELTGVRSVLVGVSISPEEGSGSPEVVSLSVVLQERMTLVSSPNGIQTPRGI